MAISQPGLHQQRQNRKEGFSSTGKCKVTMKYDWKGIQSKVFDGEKS